jgi:hypothetical protein
MRVHAAVSLPFPNPLREIYLPSFALTGESDSPIEDLGARILAKSPRDWKILVGVGLLAGNKEQKLAYFQEAAKLAPQEPIPVAARALTLLKELSYRRKENWRSYGRPLLPDFKETFLSPEAARPSQDTLEQWQKFDPENAVPKALLAWIYFGEKQEAAAQNALRAAVDSSRIDFYAGSSQQLSMAAAKAGGLPAFEASNLRAELSFRHFAKVRDLARIATYKGYEAQAAGRSEEAIAYWTGVVKLGRLMRVQGQTYLESLVGMAIEAIGASPVYKWSTRERAADRGLKPAYPLTGKTGRYDRGDIFEGNEHDFFLKQAGSTATAGILAEMMQSQETKNLMRQSLKSDRFLSNYIRASDLLQPGAIMLAGAVLFMILAGLAALLLIRKSQERARLRNFWAGIFILLGLAPFWIVWLYCEFRTYTRTEVDFGISLSDQPNALEGVLISGGITLFGLVWAALWIWRKSKGERSFGWSYLSLLRQVSLLVFLLLTLSYGGLTIQTALLRARVVKQITTQIKDGELAQMQREHPELFAPPKVTAVETAKGGEVVKPIR